jgi:chemotaxis signal transduction protein
LAPGEQTGTVSDAVGEKMKNVIVFSIGQDAYAVELGWIREVFTLAHVTPVPHAPTAIAGVVNFRGSILSILDLRGLRGGRGQASQGESALLLEVDRCQAALRAGTIDEVSSLLPDPISGTLLDSRQREVTLLDPPKLFDAAMNNRSLAISPVASNEE